MVAIAIPWVIPSAVVLPCPPQGEAVGGGVHVIGCHLVAGIDAAGEEDAGLAAVEEGCSEEVFRGAVAVAVAPVAGFATGKGILHRSHCIVDDAVVAIHIYKVFATGVGVCHIGGVAHAAAGVHALGAYALGVFGARTAALAVHHHVVGTTEKHLGLAVAVPVVGYEVELMAAAAHHIGTGVDPPQQGAVELVGVETVVGSIGAAHIQVVGILGADALDDNLHLTIAVEVGHLGIIGGVGVGDVGAALVVDFSKGDVEIARPVGGGERILVAGPHCCGLALRLLGAAHHGAHRVGVGGGAALVGVVGGIHRICIELNAVTVEVILHVVVFLAQTAPTEKHAVVGLHGHKTTA